MRQIILATFCFVAQACGEIFAQTIVVNDNIRLLPVPPASFPGGFGLHASKCLTFDGPACADAQPSVGFDYDGATVDVTSITLDEGMDLFIAQPGDIFSEQTVAAGAFPTLTNSGPPIGPTSGTVSGPASVGSGDFYFGVRTTGRGFVGASPGIRSVYGWAHLRPVDGKLTMVENVMAYNTRGIVVGTKSVVPEPATLSIVLAALAMSFRRVRRSRLGVCAQWIVG